MSKLHWTVRLKTAQRVKVPVNVTTCVSSQLGMTVIYTVWLVEQYTKQCLFILSIFAIF